MRDIIIERIYEDLEDIKIRYTESIGIGSLRREKKTSYRRIMTYGIR